MRNDIFETEILASEIVHWFIEWRLRGHRLTEQNSGTVTAEIAGKLQKMIQKVIGVAISATRESSKSAVMVDGAEDVREHLERMRVEAMLTSQQPLVDEVPPLTPEQGERFKKILLGEFRIGPRPKRLAWYERELKCHKCEASFGIIYKISDGVDTTKLRCDSCGWAGTITVGSVDISE